MRGRVDEGEREVEPALHPAGVAACTLRSAACERPTRSSSASPRAARSAAREPLERRLQLQMLATREQRVEGGLLERGADRRAHLRALVDDVEARPRARCPPVGGSSVVSMCTVVDLPAPFGPRKP